MSSKTFLVDTNVLSELARREPNSGVLAWSRTVSTISVSVITVEEIFFGFAWKPNQRIQAWLEEFLDVHGVICPVTAEVARLAGQLRGNLAALGETRTQADMIIAATVQFNQQTLVTRNVRDFADCGISVLNPFS